MSLLFSCVRVRIEAGEKAGFLWCEENGRGRVKGRWPPWRPGRGWGMSQRGSGPKPLLSSWGELASSPSLVWNRKLECGVRRDLVRWGWWAPGNGVQNFDHMHFFTLHLLQYISCCRMNQTLRIVLSHISWDPRKDIHDRGKSTGAGVRKLGFRSWLCHLTNCVALRKSHHFLEPQFLFFFFFLAALSPVAEQTL